MTEGVTKGGQFVGDTKKITIVGAGLAGTLLSIYLARRCFEVEVFEAMADMRREYVPAGRSINLTLSERGTHALREVGLYNIIEEFAVPISGRIIHDQSGSVRNQMYSKGGEKQSYPMPRERLNIALLDAAEATGKVKIHFRHKLENLDFEKGFATFVNEQDGSRKEVAIGNNAGPVIGADGACSKMRECLNEYTDLGVTKEVLESGYKELSIPASREGSFQMPSEGVHVWPRGGHLMIALPNPDRSFNAIIFLPKKGANSFEQIANAKPSEIQSWFEQEFPDAAPLMPDAVKDLIENPVGCLGTIRCRKWPYGGEALILGDAAHAITPLYAQGTNVAFEDVSVFNQLLKNTDQSWEELFEEFQKLRQVNTDAIADMALENYTELRCRVRDPRFQLKKELEQILEERHPERFIPRYNMVTFHRIPYAIAKERGEIQETILDELTLGKDKAEDIDLVLADRLIEERLDKRAE